jgi:hypothetical protein
MYNMQYIITIFLIILIFNLLIVNLHMFNMGGSGVIFLSIYTYYCLHY